MWTVRLFGWTAPPYDEQAQYPDGRGAYGYFWRPRQGARVERIGLPGRGAGFALYLGVGRWWRRLQFEWTE